MGAIKLVPRAGIEPARVTTRRILSPVRLPVPPPRHVIYFKARTYLFLKNGVLQRTRTSDPLIKSQMLYQLS